MSMHIIRNVRTVGNRHICYWASEESPTPGCSIEISRRDIYVTGSRKRDHFVDLLESRYRRLNSDNNNKTFFADLSFLLANGSRIFPLSLYQILRFVLFSK